MTENKEFHEVANIFPLMEGEDFEAFKADIAANGLREAIWLHPDGRIIDGRNRYRACQESGIEPTFRTWSGDGSLIAFVVSLNLHRRHLTSSQAAAVGLEALPFFEEEAKRRQLATQNNNSGRAVREIIPEQDSGRSRDHAAKACGTNPRYISDAKKLKEEAPEIFEEVKAGRLNIPEAKEKMLFLRKDESTLAEEIRLYMRVARNATSTAKKLALRRMSEDDFKTLQKQCLESMGIPVDEDFLSFFDQKGWA